MASKWSARLGESSHSIALTVGIPRERLVLHLISNADWEPLDLELPQTDNPWHRWIDTALESPFDIVQWETSESILGHTYRAEARSVVMLFTRF